MNTPKPVDFVEQAWAAHVRLLNLQGRTPRLKDQREYYRQLEAAIARLTHWLHAPEGSPLALHFDRMRATVALARQRLPPDEPRSRWRDLGPQFKTYFASMWRR